MKGGVSEEVCALLSNYPLSLEFWILEGFHAASVTLSTLANFRGLV